MAERKVFLIETGKCKVPEARGQCDWSRVRQGERRIARRLDFRFHYHDLLIVFHGATTFPVNWISDLELTLLPRLRAWTMKPDRLGLQSSLYFPEAKP